MFPRFDLNEAGPSNTIQQERQQSEPDLGQRFTAMVNRLQMPQAMWDTPSVAAARGRRIHTQHQDLVGRVLGIDTNLNLQPDIFGEWRNGPPPAAQTAPTLIPLMKRAAMAEQTIAGMTPDPANQRRMELAAKARRKVLTEAIEADLQLNGIRWTQRRPWAQRNSDPALVGPAKPLAQTATFRPDEMRRRDWLRQVRDPQNRASRLAAALGDRTDLAWHETITTGRYAVDDASIAVYDRDALQNLLNMNRTILTDAGWPTDADGFVRNVSELEFIDPADEARSDLYDLIAVAYADPRFTREFAIDPDRPTRNVRLPPDVELARLPEYFQPPEPTTPHVEVRIDTDCDCGETHRFWAIED